MPSSAIHFAERAHAGDFDEISDSNYEGRFDDTDALFSFWNGKAYFNGAH